MLYCMCSLPWTPRKKILVPVLRTWTPYDWNRVGEKIFHLQHKSITYSVFFFLICYSPGCVHSMRPFPLSGGGHTHWFFTQRTLATQRLLIVVQIAPDSVEQTSELINEDLYTHCNKLRWIDVSANKMWYVVNCSRRCWTKIKCGMKYTLR